ncbi:MAG: hypothetical protein ACK559_31505, partial [bacterium]
ENIKLNYGSSNPKIPFALPGMQLLVSGTKANQFPQGRRFVTLSLANRVAGPVTNPDSITGSADPVPRDLAVQL